MCFACDTAVTLAMLPFKQPLALLPIHMAALVSDKDACGAGLKWVPLHLIFSQSNHSTTHRSQPQHNPMQDKESALSVHSSLLALIIRTFYKAPVSIAIGAGCWPTVGALPLQKLNGSALTLARVRCPGPG